MSTAAAVLSEVAAVAPSILDLITQAIAAATAAKDEAALANLRALLADGQARVDAAASHLAAEIADVNAELDAAAGADK